MIIPDINLLLYAYDADSPFHRGARVWWQNCLSGEEPIGLAPVVLFGFVRIATSRRIFHSPMTGRQAVQHVRSWLSQPPAQLLEPRRDDVEKVLSLIETLSIAGHLITDLQIAALAMAHDAVVHTADSDFLRVSGLRWANPLSGARSGPIRR